MEMNFEEELKNTALLGTKTRPFDTSFLPAQMKEKLTSLKGETREIQLLNALAFSHVRNQLAKKLKKK